VTPDQRHRGMDGELLKQREAVYEMARQRNPGRFRLGLSPPLGVRPAPHTATVSALRHEFQNDFAIRRIL
jgi:hypothetical protein